MLRCDKPAGTYEVSFTSMNDDGQDRPGDFNAPIGAHQRVFKNLDTGDLHQGESPPPNGSWAMVEEPPRVLKSTGYRGELCEHEVEYLRTIPGKAFSLHWRYGLKSVTNGKGG